MINHVVVIDQVLHVFEASLNSVLSINEAIIRNLVDAVNGRVTTSLFPVEDLLHTLEIGQSTYKLTPLYSQDMIQHYYPLLESTLTTDAIIINIPFKSLDHFDAYEVTTFPFSVNNSVMILDMNPSLVLIAKDFALYAVGDLAALMHCKSSYLHLYHCSSNQFAFLPVVKGICEVALTRSEASAALSLCPYKHVVSQPIFHRNFHGFHYFYFTENFYVSVTCPEGNTYEEVIGHYAVQDACHVRSSKLTTYPSRFHLAFTAKLSYRVFPVTSLMNLTRSRIPFITNSLSTFSFSNQEEFSEALETSLPVYLQPRFLYPSVLTPFLILVFVIISLYMCFRKAMNLYEYLDSRRKRLAVSPSTGGV